MSRPVEYENLIKRDFLQAQPATPGAIAAYVANAANYLAAARLLDPGQMTMQTFSLAYEGLFQLVQAVLEWREVRTKDAGRNMAFQLACKDLGMEIAQQRVVTGAHARRNGTSYQSPFPPISKAEAEELVNILAASIPLVRKLTGVPEP